MTPWKTRGTLALLALLAGCATPTAPVAPSGERPVAGASAQVERQAAGPGVYELVYSPRRGALFVAVAGGYEESSPTPRLLRLDPRTLAVVAELTLPFRGFGLALDDDADRLYISNPLDGRITAVDTVRNRVIESIQVTAKTQGPDGRERPAVGLRKLVIDAANHRLYAPGHDEKNSVLHVVDTRAMRLVKVIPGLGLWATGIALDPSGKRLFISNLAGTLHVVDTERLVIRKSFDSGVDQPLNLAYDPASKRLFATDQGLLIRQQARQQAQPGYVPRPGNRVIVLDGDSGQELASLPTAENPIALQLDSVRHRLYVTTRDGGTVDVFDSQTNKLVQRVALPPHPNSLTQDERGNVLFVSIKNGEQAPKDQAEEVARIPF